jgi:hypothetical protein
VGHCWAFGVGVGAVLEDAGHGVCSIGFGVFWRGELDALLVWLSAMPARIVDFEEKQHVRKKFSY